MNDRIFQSQAEFRWVAPCGIDKQSMLQFQVSDGFFVDLIYTKKSNFLNSGYGLFLARVMPKGLLFSLFRSYCSV